MDERSRLGPRRWSHAESRETGTNVPHAESAQTLLGACLEKRYCTKNDTAKGNEMSTQTKSSEYDLSILYLSSDIVPITTKHYHAGIEPRGFSGQHSPIIDNDCRSRAAGATTS